MNLAVDQSTRFFVVHLQKTAGTTLRDRFRATLPDRSIYPHRSDGPNILHAIISLSHLLERWQVRRDEIRLIAGHFPLSTVQLLNAEFVTCSILRPPVDRTLSYLRHQKQVNKKDRCKSLEEIYDDPFRFNGLVRNHMTRMFGIGTEQMRVGDGALTDVPDTEELLERAKRGVAGLTAFGLQPRFEEFWQRFARQFGLDQSASVVSNATKPENAPLHLIDRIMKDNPLDLQLYDFAERLYDERYGSA